MNGILITNSPFGYCEKPDPLLAYIDGTGHSVVILDTFLTVSIRLAA